MFFRRGVAENDRWLVAKMWLFSIGAVLALLGMLLKNDWLIGAAGVVLLGGILLRFIGRGADGDGGDGESDGGESDGGDSTGSGPSGPPGRNAAVD